MNTAGPCLISAVLFYISSIHWLEFKSNRDAEYVEAKTKASNYDFSDTASVQNYGHFKATKKAGENMLGKTEYKFKAGPDFTVVRETASTLGVKKSAPIMGLSHDTSP